MAGSLDLTDTDLSHLFERYPDISFDLVDNFTSASSISEQFSSPCSNTTVPDDASTPKKSLSTAHTTPVRPSNTPAKEPLRGSFEFFLQRLEAAELPLDTKEQFRDLARSITKLGALLVPAKGLRYEGYVASNSKHILSTSHTLRTQLKESVAKVDEQIETVEFVRTRAPFTIANLAEEDLWCNFRQRAKLVADYCALPCRTERKMLEELTHVFDAYVHHSFLELLDLGEITTKIEDSINELHTVLMTLLHKYNMWLQAMMDIKQNHMKPLMDKIKDSPKVLQDIDEVEKSAAAARAAIGSSDDPGMKPADEKTIRELTLSARRRPLFRRLRSRYRREHTV